MEAFALLDARNNQVKLYACGSCGITQSPSQFKGIKEETIPYEERLKRAKIHAENCCRDFKHMVPGKDYEKVYTNCTQCQGNLDPKWYETICSACKDRNNWEKAEKIKASEWNGPVFHGDDFYMCVEDLLDGLDYDDIGKEDHQDLIIWAGEKDQWKGLDADKLIEDELSDYQAEGYEPEATDVEELRQFLLEWNQKQDVCVYHPNVKKAIILDTEVKD